MYWFIHCDCFCCSSLISGFIVKVLLNVSLINAFYKLGLPAYYGVITATILGYLVSFIVCVVVLATKYKINFEDCVKHFVDILCASMFMFIILFILNLFVPICVNVRFMNILIILLYAVIGALVYFMFLIKTRTVNGIFGNRLDRYVKKVK